MHHNKTNKPTKSVVSQRSKSKKLPTNKRQLSKLHTTQSPSLSSSIQQKIDLTTPRCTPVLTTAPRTELPNLTTRPVSAVSQEFSQSISNQRLSAPLRLKPTTFTLSKHHKSALTHHKSRQVLTKAQPTNESIISASFFKSQSSLFSLPQSTSIRSFFTTSTPSTFSAFSKASKKAKSTTLKQSRRRLSASPEDSATQGANLVQVQQAVNQWAQLNFRGMEFLKAGGVTDLDDAEACFNECANAMEQYPLLPYRSLSLANLASCLMRKGNYKEAIKIFQPLTQQLLLFKQVSISQIATIHMELASAYELSGQHDLAVKELYVASSRYVHAAAHYLGQIQASDNTHFHSLTSSPQPKPISTLVNTPGDKSTPTHPVLREDERQMTYQQALECWRTALGCRYSAIVLQHRLNNLDFAATELTKLSVVYKYVLNTIESVQKYRWDRGEGEIDDISMITNDKGEYIDIDKSLTPHPHGIKMLELYPQCPPEAKVVTHDLCRLFPDLSLAHIQDISARVTVELVSVLHSLANVYIDQGNFEEVCKVLHQSVDVMDPLDEESFLKVASESSKTLRLLYEKLLLEHQQYTDTTANEPRVIQISDQAKVRFENKAAVESTIKLLNTTRANIFALFNTYIQGHMLRTKDPIDTEVFGTTAAQQAGAKTGEFASNYQSSASSSTISLDDLPPDAQRFFNFGRDSFRRDYESGQFYEHMREVYKREMGAQFNENHPQLIKLKPSGYKALHERQHMADVNITDTTKQE